MQRTVAALISAADEDLVVLATALAEIAPDARLVLLVVHDAEQSQSLADRVSSRNFVGLKLSQQLARAMDGNVRDRQATLVDEAAARARAAGFEATVIERTGPLGETLRKACQELDLQRIYVPRSHGSLISRLLGSDPLRAIPCPLVQVDLRR